MSRHRIILFAIFVYLSCNVVAAFEENPKFCIRTEPMLLDDIEKHVNPLENDAHCEVLATTMTLKEKESFVNTMCKDLGTTNKENYVFFKVRNGDLTGRGSYHDICKGHINPLLAWIPYNTVLQNYAHELNPKERMNYIAKATDVDREKTELCHFRHTDLVSNITSNLFTCVVMVFEDNFYGLDSNINVLVELQPLMYEILNITYVPWFNVTNSYKTMLGKSVLKNPSQEKKPTYSSISYAFVEKVKLNLSSVYGENLEKLPVLFEHKGSVLELDSNGIGGLDIKEKAYFGRTMDPKTVVKVDVTGQWAEHRQQFTADIYDYYGYGIKRFHSEMHNGEVTFVRIESTEPVFEMPESTNLASATLHKERLSFERLTADSNNDTAVKTEWDAEDFADYPHGESPYPKFYPWFVVSMLIMGVVLLAAVYGMVRSCSKKEEKHKYKIAPSCA